MAGTDLAALLAELNAAGYRHAACASAMNVGSATLYKISRDPLFDPGWTVGDDLRELHARLVNGISKWGRMVDDLTRAKMTYAQIGAAIGVDASTVHKWHNDPTTAPSFANGEALIRHHCEMMKSLGR